MRGKPKHGHHRQERSNKHYKQKNSAGPVISGSDGDLVFINKDKPMLLPSLKKAGSTVVEYFEWDVLDLA
jgi:hypothetical protein